MITVLMQVLVKPLAKRFMTSVSTISDGSQNEILLRCNVSWGDLTSYPIDPFYFVYTSSTLWEN